ncbi:MAG: glycosyltransferase family 4 protein [Gammaproteobacteria bacterium]
MSRQTVPKRATLLTHEYPPFPGGEATYCEGIVSGLRALGWEATVIAPDYGNGDEDKTLAGVNVHRLFCHHRFCLAGILAFVRRLLPQMKDNFFIAGEVRAGFVLAILTLFTPLRFAVMFHGSELAKARSRLLYRIAIRFVIGRAFRVCTNSRATERLLQAVSRGLDTRHKSAITLLGLDPFWLTPPTSEQQRHDLLEAAGLTDVQPADAVILTVGRIEPRKGTLDALATVAASRPLVRRRIVHILVGRTVDQAYGQAVEAEAARIGPDVRALGVVSRERLRALYRVADALVLPGRSIKGKFEGFGLVFTEAASQGCPSLASRIGGVEDAVAEGRSGFLFDEHDHDGMSRRLGALLTHSESRLRLRDSCIEHAQSFRWDSCARTTLGAAGTTTGPS